MAFSESGTQFIRHSLYASGNLGKNCLWSYVELFALFYFTDILGMPPALAGMVLLLSLIWDGLTDPLMGIAADRLREKFATVRVYFLAGAPLSAGAFILMFHAGAVPLAYRNLFVLLATVLFRTMYTIVDVPHNSMLSFLSRDSRDRTNIASLRIFASAVGKLVVTFTMMSIINDTSLGSMAERFSFASLIFAAVYIAVMGLCLASIWNIPVQHRAGAHEPGRLMDLVSRITANSQLLIVFMLTAVTSLTTPIIGTAIIYYGKYGLANNKAGLTALVIMSLGQASSLVFWSKLTNRLRYKKHACQSANLLLAGAMLVAVFCLGSVWTLYVVAAFAGFAIGGIFMLNWSMLPDAMDSDPRLVAQRHNMSVFGLYTLTNKGFIGLSQALVGLTLASFGYEANSALAGARIHAIISSLMMWPLFGAMACVIILLWHTQIQAQRNQDQKSPPVADGAG